MNIAVVHYHARPGGVTRVVERAVEALGGRANCLFFTGEAAMGETPLQDKIRVVPNLGYSTEQNVQPLEKQMGAACEAYGPEAYGDHLASIYHRLMNTTPEPVQYADGQQLLNAFLDPGRFNLLRT